MRADGRFVITFIGLLLLGSWTTAQEEATSRSAQFRGFSRGDANHNPWGRMSRGDWRPPDRDQGQREWNAPLRETNDGFLFVNGNYVAPPYRLEVKDGELNVNGLETGIKGDQLRIGNSENDDQSGRSRTSFGFDNPVYSARVIADKLDGDAVILLWSDAPPMAITPVSGANEVVRAISNPAECRMLLASEDWSFLSKNQHPAQWQSFLSDLQVSPGLASRAAAYTEKIDRIVLENETRALAVRRLNQWDYPLMLVGMILVTAAFGHLLMSVPRPTDQPSQATRAVIYSVGLVAALSALDLVWTILTSQAGHMRELNPVASSMIEQPMVLLAFKASVTMFAIGIIVLLRKHRPARLGAWWACLICTLLTVRWLVIDTLTV